MLQQERERSGIASLKLGFNKVFGYYLEVSNAHKNRVPGHYLRKQTLTNGERYITQELKEFEEKILSAEERSVELEQNWRWLLTMCGLTCWKLDIRESFVCKLLGIQ